MKTNPNDSAFSNSGGRLGDIGVTPAVGLTKREYFAAMATDIPWDATIETLRLKGITKPTVQEVLEYRAVCRRLFADLLIDELNKENPTP